MTLLDPAGFARQARAVHLLGNVGDRRVEVAKRFAHACRAPLADAHNRGRSPDGDAPPRCIQLTANLVRPRVTDKQLRSIAAPVLLFVAEHSEAFSPTKATRSTEALIPDVDVDTVTDAATRSPPIT